MSASWTDGTDYRTDGSRCSGIIDTTGNPAVLQTLMSLTDEPDPSFAITTP